MNSSSKFLFTGSPNVSRINNPLAESTAIGSPLTQQHETHRGNQKRKTISPLANSHKHRQMMTQIEPHILTNAQSRGIVKRLVTYYDESQSEAEKNKYVYNRLGDFPIVQLRKQELKRNLVRSTSVRIAPPSKTVMNRDVRSAILRSNSFQLGPNVPKLLPTKMRAKDDSHQIITNHEPLTLNHESVQSAKSVLDALEKNCRKRISNEELTLDRNKRMCAPNTPLEVVDGREFAPIVPQSAKRNRDQVSPSKTGLGDSPFSQLRKRSKIRNNALLSSLSSSNFVLKPYTASPSSSFAAVAKVPTFSTATTSQPQLANIVEQSEKQMKEVSIASEKKVDDVINKPEPRKLYLFNRKIEAPVRRTHRVDTENDDDDDEIKINFIKPRVTTSTNGVNIVRHIDKDKLSKMLTGLSGGFSSTSPTKTDPKDSVDAPQASISFNTSTFSVSSLPITTPASAASSSPSGVATKPEVSSAFSVKTSEIEKVTAAVEGTKEDKAAAPIGTLSFPFPASMTTSSSPSFGVATATTTVSTASGDPSEKVSPLTMFSTPSNNSKPSSNVEVDSNKSLISFTPVAKATDAIAATTSAVLITSAIPKATIAPSLSINAGGFSLSQSATDPAKPSGGFSFGGTSSTISFPSAINQVVSSVPIVAPINTPSLASAASSSSLLQTLSSNAFSFGAKPTNPTVATSIVNPMSSGIPGITLPGNSGNLTSTTSFIQKPATTTASGIGFRFSNSAASKPSIPVVTTTSSGFSFGSSQTTMGSSTLNAPVTTANSSFTFGSSNTSGFGAPVAASTGFVQPSATSGFGQPAATSTGFGPSNSTPAFGAAPSANPSGFGNSAGATPMFGGNSTTTTTAGGFPALSSTASFSFGQQSTNQASGFPNTIQKSESAASSNMFSFGQNASVAPSPSANTSFPFGGGAVQPAPATSAFSFGQNNSTQQASVASPPAGIFGRLGDKPAEAKPAFSFGGSTQPQQPIFGGSNNPSAQPAPPLFGQSTNSGFGQPSVGGGNMFGGTPSNNQSSDFGGNAKSPGGNLFAFGNSSNNNPQQPNQPAPAGMFSFGNSNPPSNNAPSGVFGGNQGQNVSASFTFKPSTGVVTNNSAPNAFGQNSSGPPPAYQFGQTNSNNASASFTFAPNQNPNSAPTAPTSSFNYGAPQSAPVTGGSFNFQGQQPILTPQPSPGGGLFNIGTGGNQQRRPIRQAMRRMK